jgi:acyl-CoA reductase-like NAD-dependent aldehyde dehydrogenase
MGGKTTDEPGAFMQPPILTDIKPGNPAFTEEFFGPVGAFPRDKNKDKAVALANDSDFGLESPLMPSPLKLWSVRWQAQQLEQRNKANG